jgi:c-di-AMP phosphodiesterase-like protein
MFRESRLFTPVISVLMILCAVLTGLTLFFDYTLFLVSASITLVSFAVLLFLLRRLSKKSARILGEIREGIRYTGDNAFMDAPVPVLTVYNGAEIIWYNDLCANDVFAGIDMRGEAIANVLPQVDVTATSPPEGTAIFFKEREYTAYVSVSRRGEAEIAVVDLVDDSQLKHFAEEYHLSRPSVAIIMVDNYEEMVQDYKDVERSQLVGQIENEIEKYFADNAGFVIRIERDKFLAVVEERGIRQIITNKFSILDKVRGIQTSSRLSATLSIGVGREADSLYESESMARQALDMCLGRGGDQVAVRNQNGYEFYGGVSKGIEKRTKVKTRIIANALSELIESSGNVVIMGHRFADLDCLGSAVGMLKAIKSMNKPAVICIDREKNLVKPLLERLEAGSYSPEDFIAPEAALERIHHHTLLIVLDTHVPQVLESLEVYKACRNVVVIDHHRKLVSYIDNAVIFYHEPYASSASEMVTELIQYFPSQPQITKLEAEALLSGVMLDTKNFILRTGVRTFEAAAYLRRVGADTVEVRKLFANSMESYQQKTNLVANAEIYKGCAIAATDYTFEGIKLTAPQAADELMNIAEVRASFVIFLYEKVVNVSARSMGEINVQVIMEKLGGGGHLTMAAAQFPDDTTENIREQVMKAIDDYFAEQSDNV